MHRARRLDHEWGQASVEVVAALPAMIATGLVLLQLLAVGYTMTLVDGAAEAVRHWRLRPAATPRRQRETPSPVGPGVGSGWGGLETASR